MLSPPLSAVPYNVRVERDDACFRKCPSVGQYSLSFNYCCQYLHKSSAIFRPSAQSSLVKDVCKLFQLQLKLKPPQKTQSIEPNECGFRNIDIKGSITFKFAERYRYNFLSKALFIHARIVILTIFWEGSINEL